MRAYGGYRNQWWPRAERQNFEDSSKVVAFKNTLVNATRVTGYTTSGSNKRMYQVRNYNGSYHAGGVLKQLVYVNFANNVVIVRLGCYWRHPQYGSEAFLYAVGKAL